jgi:hypothetical protein
MTVTWHVAYFFLCTISCPVVPYSENFPVLIGIVVSNIALTSAVPVP